MRRDIQEITFMNKKQNVQTNYAKIAKQHNCDRRTVKKYLENNDLPFVTRKPRKVKKKTDGLEEIIMDKYVNHGAPIIAIYNLLKSNYDYTGSYSTLKRFVNSHAEELKQKATIRYETNKGLQCQIDWKENLTIYSKNGEEFVINIFLAILGYSRLKYIELTLDKTQPTLFRCLTNAIKYFKGTPKEFLFDNMKTVVDRSRTQFQRPVYNTNFYYFCKDAGFEPKSCLAYKPQTKGKVETVAKIMNRIKAYNNEFESIEELDAIVNELREQINNEVQQTTKETPIKRFQKEKEHLNQEPNYEILEEYFLQKAIRRKVSKESLINYQTKRYSVPISYIGKIVTIEANETHLYIYYNNKLISTHEITSKLINYREQDYREIYRSYNNQSAETFDQCITNLKLFDNLGD